MGSRGRRGYYPGEKGGWPSIVMDGQERRSPSGRIEHSKKGRWAARQP
jgi:hypothetical protein